MSVLDLHVAEQALKIATGPFTEVAISVVLCHAVPVQMVCAESQVQQPGDFLCGTLGDARYLLVRGQDGQLRAFHNVRCLRLCSTVVSDVCWRNARVL